MSNRVRCYAAFILAALAVSLPYPDTADGTTQRNAQRVTRVALWDFAAATAPRAGETSAIGVARCRYRSRVAFCPFTVTSRTLECRGQMRVRAVSDGWLYNITSLNCQERP